MLRPAEFHTYPSLTVVHVGRESPAPAICQWQLYAFRQLQAVLAPCRPASINTTTEPAPSSIVLSRDMSRPAHGLPAQQAPHRMRTLGTLALSPFSLTDGRTTRPADLPTLLA